jgi:hypothetical protein
MICTIMQRKNGFPAVLGNERVLDSYLVIVVLDQFCYMTVNIARQKHTI